MSVGATLQNHRADGRAEHAPNVASTRLSVSSCATMRDRPAPSAERTASSRARTLPRASSRFATLAQHSSSTNPTTPSRRRDVFCSARAHHAAAQRLDDDAPALVRLGIGLREPVGDHREIRLRGVEGDTGLEAADRLEKPDALRGRFGGKVRSVQICAGRCSCTSSRTMPMTVNGWPLRRT